MHTEQKVWSNWSLRQQNYLNYPTFTEYFVICYVAKKAGRLVGPLFVGAPVWPNMPNMPKSASAISYCEGFLGWFANLLSLCGFLNKPNYIRIL